MEADISLRRRGGSFERLLASTGITVRAEVLETESGLAAVHALLAGARDGRRSVFIIGNGGSAAVAAHIANDLANVARLRALTLHDPSVFTCMANDYGYENAFARLVDTMAVAGDVLIAISSSGNSPNIRNAVAAIKGRDGHAITLSGFKADNPLRAMGDINIWVPSEDYGMVEIAHLFILHNLADRFRLGRG